MTDLNTFFSDKKTSAQAEVFYSGITLIQRLITRLITNQYRVQCDFNHLIEGVLTLF
ncbi:Uncharacterised protein [Vibrio cholerae]|nr:Uncharacterised protein [Vibrio cholerae]